MQAGPDQPALPARKTGRNALGRACGYETIRQPRSLLPFLILLLSFSVAHIRQIFVFILFSPAVVRTAD